MTKKLWTAIITIGLAGQLAWTVENMYFNVFLYNTISTNPDYIARMVSLSAVAATATTILIGSLSDRIGKRKLFISLGYVLWAISVALFAFISPENLGGEAKAAWAVILMDVIMTFFGSTANDACFNAYVTEQVESKDRAKSEGVIQILPLISMLLVFGLLDGMTQKGNWPLFFMIISSLMLVSGIASFFLLDKEPSKKLSGKSYKENLAFGFKPSTIKNNKELYIVLAAFCINSIGMQVFYPYLIIYVQQYLGFDNYAIILGILLIAASIISVIGGRMIDRIGKLKAASPSILIMAVGMFLLYFARSFSALIITGIIMMGGYLLSSSTLSAMLRDLTPKGNEGGIQGVRMIALVLIPMVLGPNIGSMVIKGSAETYIELGVEKTMPSPDLFIVAGIIVLISIIPIVILKSNESKKRTATA